MKIVRFFDMSGILFALIYEYNTPGSNVKKGIFGFMNSDFCYRLRRVRVTIYIACRFRTGHKPWVQAKIKQ